MCGVSTSGSTTSKSVDGAYLSSSPPIGEDLPWQSGSLGLHCWLGSRNQDWRDCCNRPYQRSVSSGSFVLPDDSLDNLWHFVPRDNLTFAKLRKNVMSVNLRKVE